MRAELGEHAPRIEQIKIPTDKIRDVIGTGGKVIREIVEKTGAKINVEDDGTIKIASADGESIKAAIKWIKGLTAEPEVGEIYDGKVVKVMDFGAFVNFFGPKDGLVHVSELAQQARQQAERRGRRRPGREGQAARLRRSRQGRLSMKQVDQATGDLSKKRPSSRRDNSLKPRRLEGGDRPVGEPDGAVADERRIPPVAGARPLFDRRHRRRGSRLQDRLRPEGGGSRDPRQPASRNATPS
jgi:polyribonucleotide nucleotidyltransferase